jgi:hypothetical protein
MSLLEHFDVMLPVFKELFWAFVVIGRGDRPAYSYLLIIYTSMYMLYIYAGPNCSLLATVDPGTYRIPLKKSKSEGISYYCISFNELY